MNRQNEMGSRVARRITPWIKASASDSSGTSVEIRRNGDAVEVRDSKNPDGPVLRFTIAEVAAWIDGVSKGEFDHLSDPARLCGGIPRPASAR